MLKYKFNKNVDPTLCAKYDLRQFLISDSWVV